MTERFSRVTQVLLAAVTVLALIAVLIPQLSLAAEDVGAVVDLVLLPSSQTVDVDDVFDVVIQAQCNGQDITGIAAFIDFDPVYLEVQSVTDGDTLTNFVVSDYDNVAGTIDYNAGTFTQPLPSGTFTVTTIEFKAMNPDGNVSLNFSVAFPRESDADFGGGSKLSDLYGTIIAIMGEPTPENNDNAPSEPPPGNSEEPNADPNSLPDEDEDTSQSQDEDEDALQSPDEDEDTSQSQSESESDSPSDDQSQENLPTDDDGTDWYIPASIIIGLAAIGMIVVFVRRQRSS